MDGNESLAKSIKHIKCDNGPKFRCVKHVHCVVRIAFTANGDEIVMLFGYLW